MSNYHAPTQADLAELSDIANRIRINGIRATTKCKSGHPTSSASCADILSVLFFKVMRYKANDPRDAASDRFVMSKGHACPALYAAWVETGHLSQDDFMTLREYKSIYEGHPTPAIDFIDVATGSLGQGLGMACGMAYAAKYIEQTNFRVYCLLGDGEVAEGAVWEAMAFASHYKLNNLVAIIDVNRLGQSEPTALAHDVDTYAKRAAAFGWNAVVVDGHNIETMCKEFHHANESPTPTCFVAKTFKGRGMIGQEDLLNFHGKPVSKDAMDGIVDGIRAKLNNKEKVITTMVAPAPSVKACDVPNLFDVKLDSPPKYEKGQKIATRQVYGQALIKLAQSCPRLYALDGDMKNSTFSQDYMKKFPEKFVECFIAEQNMTAVAIGMATRDRCIAFCSTFAAFLCRAYDHIRMGAVCHTNVNFFGSHCGISIGADGPSQMALEDLAMFRAIPSATVLYPSDAVSCERAVELVARQKGIGYIRGTRATTSVVHDNDAVFAIGKSMVVRQKEGDKVTVVAGGVTLDEAMKAAATLEGEGIGITVVDIFSLRPVDKQTILTCVNKTSGKLITVEDHYPEGGIGSAVAEALADQTGVTHKIMAVRGLPFSAPPANLLDHFGIDASAIVKQVRQMLA